MNALQVDVMEFRLLREDEISEDEQLRRENKARRDKIIAAALERLTASDEYRIGFETAFEHCLSVIREYAPSSTAKNEIERVKAEITADLLQNIKDGLTSLAIYRLNAPDADKNAR